jgi:serine/threonine protein kinase
LKPENIMIDAHGYAVLTDFGLVKEDMGAGGQDKVALRNSRVPAARVVEGAAQLWQ